VRADYSAFLQSTQVLSHCAHFVLSQSAHFALSQQDFVQACSHSVHSSAALLLLQAQDAAANIAATTANDINTFFIVTKN
jgi:hypothetical protein